MKNVGGFIEFVFNDIFDHVPSWIVSFAAVIAGTILLLTGIGPIFAFFTHVRNKEFNKSAIMLIILIFLGILYHVLSLVLI